MPIENIILLIVLDQLTKYVFFNKGLFDYSSIFGKHVLNKGISWGIKIFPFDILKILISLILVFIFWLYKKKYIGTISFTLFIAGGIGNLIDRLYFGGVRDFITINNLFPTFNLADIYITLGFLMIFIEKWLEK